MSKCEKTSPVKRIKRRLFVLWGILVGMLVYMVVIGELGFGDSRMMTPLAENISRLLFFGSMIYVITRIVHAKRLLSDRRLLLEESQADDERDRFLHDKSGGAVVDLMLLILIFITCTAALTNMPAFYTSLTILVILAAIKLGCFFMYSRKY